MGKRAASKSSQRLPLSATLGPVLLLAIIVIVGHFTQAAQAGNPLPPPGPVKPIGGPMYYGSNVGIPSITPRASLAKSNGPHFTADDVRQFIQTHPIPDAVQGAPAPIIVSIQFQSAKEVGAKYGTLSVPDSTPICVVMLYGTFFNSDAPPGFAPRPDFHDGLMIFDGYSGNLLADNVG